MQQLAVRTIVLVLFAAAGAVSLQADVLRGAVAARAAKASSARLLGAARSTTIIGSAWTSTNSPIPNALVRLRNAVSGRIEATAQATIEGEFIFQNIEGGTYVIELVDEQGHILTTGNAFTISPGETVATFVRLPLRAPVFMPALTNAGAAAVSTAASLGITAMAPSGQDVSAEQ